MASPATAVGEVFFDQVIEMIAQLSVEVTVDVAALEDRSEAESEYVKLAAHSR